MGFTAYSINIRIWQSKCVPKNTVRGQLRLGLTCPIVQESDAPIVMRSNGEGLIWVTHHLVDLCWAWKVSGERGGDRGGKSEDWDRGRRNRPLLQLGTCYPAHYVKLAGHH